ncbi:hypothetical protein SAMN05660742_10518 [Propionispira arboris]|uniref:Uncharacterized protein n=1 Tax=Propionispira arboris TaxID=84035 RepID=A0A1H6XME1_9FIRM|nr:MULTISPECIES: hypothetical protein [Propionispira]SEJ25705.1 hypothetical protein SAMN05660742_10518 [Propionispira arboris]
MEFTQYMGTMAIGFIVWLFMAPKLNNPKCGELFLAYMVTLMCCLVGTAEVIVSKPIAFFFTIGGALAFFVVVVVRMFQITIKFDKN